MSTQYFWSYYQKYCDGRRKINKIEKCLFNWGNNNFVINGVEIVWRNCVELDFLQIFINSHVNMILLKLSKKYLTSLAEYVRIVPLRKNLGGTIFSL